MALAGFRSTIKVSLVALVLLTIAPFVAFGVLDLAATRHERVEAEKARALGIANQAAERYSDTIEEARSVLDILSKLPLSLVQSPGECQRLTQRVLLGRAWVRSLWVYNDQGVAICSTAPNGLGLDVSKRDWYVTMSPRLGFQLSDFLISTFSGAPVSITSYKIPATPETPSYMFSAVLDLGWFDALGSRVIRDEGATALLFDSKGTVISHYPPMPQLIGKNLAGSALFDAMRDRPKGTVESAGVDGIERYSGFVRLPAVDVYLAIGLPRQPIVSQIAWKIGGIALFSLLVAMSAVIAAYLVGHRLLVAPLQRLSRKAEAVGAGDLTVRVDGLGPINELGDVGRNFNAMADRLQAREAELVEANEQLRQREQVLQDANRVLDDLASRDGLTRIANRRHFEMALDAAWLRAEIDLKPIALLLIDVDHFKRFNDTHGHLAGDDCLRRIARLVEAAPRRSTDLAARYGGEEFAVLLPGADRLYAEDIAEALRKAIADQRIRRRDTPDTPVTVSVGVAVLTHDQAGERDSLIATADAALYDAKVGGRDRVVVATTPHLIEPFAAPLVPQPPTTASEEHPAATSGPLPGSREWARSR